VLDPQIKTVLRMVENSSSKDLWQLSPEMARAEYLKRTKRLDQQFHITKVEEKFIPTRSGQIKVRLYWPKILMGEEKLPIIIFYHGGGFVIGGLETHDSICRFLAMETEALVISVDYRLAPEFKFPAAVNDCKDVLFWVGKNGEKFGGDIHRLAIAGDSAGGNLAAVMSILTRDETKPKICCQVLIYPVTAPEPELPSHYKFAEGYLLSRKLLIWFYSHYLRGNADMKDFRFAPLITDDLTLLPPALIITAGFDPLRDEGIRYANRLVDSGNDVVLINLSGMTHGFILMGRVVETAHVVLSEVVGKLKFHFNLAKCERES